jgi:di/tripeptidase
MKNKNLEEFLKFKTHTEVIDKVYTGIQGKNFTVHEDKKHTIIVPEDIKWGDELDIMPCIVAHTDTVSKKKPTTLKVKDGIVSNPDGVLGADDRAGCYAIWKMLKADVRAIYILTDEEEVGGIGAYECAVSVLFETLIPNISAFIELDRESSDDIALYGFDNEALNKLFEDRGYITNYGSYTDVVDLAKESGIACINLSVGYYNQHTKKEFLVLKELYRTVDVMCKDLPKELYSVVYDDEGDVLPSQWGYGSYTPPNDSQVLCACCNQHEKLYESSMGQVCKECLDYDDSWYSYRWETVEKDDDEQECAMPF